MNDLDILKTSINARKEAERIKTERLKKGIEDEARRRQEKRDELYPRY